jgi:nucleoside 2-deoxyribosyltransferase
MKKIYISGPMTGLPELNFPAFIQAAARLRAMGFEVVNPAEKQEELVVFSESSEEEIWQYFLKKDLKAMLDCDEIYMLEGWENSKGAHLEMHVAHRVGIKVLFESRNTSLVA